MFPLFNVEWSQAEANNTLGSCPVSAQPSGTSEAALLACASAQADHALLPVSSLTADIDGQTLGHLTNYRGVSPSLFEITPVAKTLFQIPLGTLQLLRQWPTDLDHPGTACHWNTHD